MYTKIKFSQDVLKAIAIVCFHTTLSQTHSVKMQEKPKLLYIRCELLQTQ